MDDKPTRSETLSRITEEIILLQKRLSLDASLDEPVYPNFDEDLGYAMALSQFERDWERICSMDDLRRQFIAQLAFDEGIHHRVIAKFAGLPVLAVLRIIEEQALYLD